MYLVSTNQPSYTGGQIVAIAVSVTSGGNPVSGAAVSVRVTKPNGSASNLSGMTGSNGVASLTYRLQRKLRRGCIKQQQTQTAPLPAPRSWCSKKGQPGGAVHRPAYQSAGGSLASASRKFASSKKYDRLTRSRPLDEVAALQSERQNPVVPRLHIRPVSTRSVWVCVR
jgi:hypothetical protein